MKTLSTLALAILLGINARCQTKEELNGLTLEQYNRKTFNTTAEYYKPSTSSGLKVTGYRINAWIRIDRNQTSANIILNIRSTPATLAQPDPSFSCIYNYGGKQYTDKMIGLEVFHQAKISDVWYKVIVMVGSKTFNLASVDGLDNFIGPVDKKTRAYDVAVFIEIASAWTTSPAIEQAIRNFISASKPKPAVVQTNTTTQNKIPNIPTGTNKAPTYPGSGTGNNTTTTTDNGAAGKGKISTGGHHGETYGPIPTGAGATDRSKLPALAMDKDGNHYHKDANNNYSKISPQQYQNLKKQAAGKTAPASAAQPASSSPAPGKPSYILDFPGVASSTESTSKFTRTVNTINTVSNAVMPLLEQWSANVQAKRQAEYERQQALEAKRAAVEAERENLVNNRKKLLDVFKAGTIPLSSRLRDQHILYYFAYSYDAQTIARDHTPLSVSEIFPLPRYQDGTWPLGKSVNDRLVKANKGVAPILVGYFTTLEEAESKYDSFLQTARTLYMPVKFFTYTKKTMGDSSWEDGSDFNQGGSPKAAPVSDEWGEVDTKKTAPANNTPPESHPKPTKIDDEWGEGPSPAVKKNTPTKKVTTTPKKPAAKPKLDEWGMPIKD